MKAHLAVLGASIFALTACGARTGLDVPSDPRSSGTTASDCRDAGTTFIYVITEENSLYSFDPPGGAFHYIGDIHCPAPAGQSPFSMAVDRRGVAYVVFSDPNDATRSGSLFQVSTADASCTATPYQPGPFGAGFDFGMGFSADTGDPGETLYVASDDPATGPPAPEQLGSIDVGSWQLTDLGTFPHVIGSAELSGTGDGKLWGFGVLDQPPVVLRLVELDRVKPGGLLSETFITLGSGKSTLIAWAFAFWGGGFYFFTSTAEGSSTVSLYQPGGSTSAAPILTLDKTIVGAGVSTCAPQQ